MTELTIKTLRQIYLSEINFPLCDVKNDNEWISKESLIKIIKEKLIADRTCVVAIEDVNWLLKELEGKNE